MARPQRGRNKKNSDERENKKLKRGRGVCGWMLWFRVPGCYARERDVWTCTKGWIRMTRKGVETWAVRRKMSGYHIPQKPSSPRRDVNLDPLGVSFSSKKKSKKKSFDPQGENTQGTNRTPPGKKKTLRWFLHSIIFTSSYFAVYPTQKNPPGLSNP